MNGWATYSKAWRTYAANTSGHDLPIKFAAHPCSRISETSFEGLTIQGPNQIGQHYRNSG